MISGFVISLTAERNQHAGRFLLARAARLYPAYWASIFLAAAVAAAGGPAVFWTDAVVNLTMVQNLFGVRDVCDVYWTLYIELQFYAIVAAFLICGRWRFAPWFLVALLAIDTAATFPQAWDRVPGWWRVTLAVPLLRYLYLFVFGIWLYRAKLHQDRWWLPVAGLCLLNRLGKGMDVEGVILLLGLAGFFTVAVFGRLPFLKVRPLVWLGTISYSLYLCHMNVGFLVIDRCLEMGLGSNESVFVASLLSIGLGALLQRYVEQPGNNWLLRRPSHPVKRRFASKLAVESAAGDCP